MLDIREIEDSVVGYGTRFGETSPTGMTNCFPRKITLRWFVEDIARGCRTRREKFNPETPQELLGYLVRRFERVKPRVNPEKPLYYTTSHNDSEGDSWSITHVSDGLMRFFRRSLERECFLSAIVLLHNHYGVEIPKTLLVLTFK